VDEQVELNDAPQAEVVDRRAMLEAGLEAAEKGEPIESIARDPAGRFASRATQIESQETQPEAEPPVWKRPPASWKKDYHDVWAKADPRMQEYAWQREEQMRAGVEPLLTKAQFADQMNEALKPYMETIRGLGMTPDKAVSALMQADHTLRNSDPQTKMAYFQQLAQSYGINLGQLQQGAQQAPQQTVDPTVWALQNELNKVRGEVMGWKQQQEMAENQKLLDEINSFSAKAEYFEEARPTMIQLLQSGVAQTLDEAYNKAVRLNEELFDKVQSAKQAQVALKQSSELNKAAKAARAAAVSVRSATPGANTAPKAQGRRALLEEAFDEMGARL
jgi:hypothetical protein